MMMQPLLILGVGIVQSVSQSESDAHAQYESGFITFEYTFTFVFRIYSIFVYFVGSEIRYSNEDIRMPK
jgi:hypothetical protein